MSREILEKRLEASRAKGLFRSIRAVDGVGPDIFLGGQKLLLLCSNNYLGLADHPALKNAAEEATVRFGTSSGASRLVSGTQSLHEELEAEVRDWKGTEKALLFNSGYAANTGIISAVAGRGDIVFSDRLNHASIIDGVILSGAKLVRYPHNDLSALEKLMQHHKTDGVRLIVTDGVFSMDGDIANLAGLAKLAKAFNAILMVDDAHGGGVIGTDGRGSADLAGVMSDVDIHMGTFGKALGSFGAYVATSALIRDYLVNRARSLIFSTSLPPAVLAASLAAIKIVRSSEGKSLRLKLSDNIALFQQKLNVGGLNIASGSTPIIPVQIGDPELVMQISRRLLDAGLFLQGIRPPTVPVGTSRLRCTIMATHRADDMIYAASSIISVLKQSGVI